MTTIADSSHGSMRSCSEHVRLRMIAMEFTIDRIGNARRPLEYG
jgi:hypothetical protein